MASPPSGLRTVYRLHQNFWDPIDRGMNDQNEKKVGSGFPHCLAHCPGRSDSRKNDGANQRCRLDESASSHSLLTTYKYTPRHDDFSIGDNRKVGTYFLAIVVQFFLFLIYYIDKRWPEALRKFGTFDSFHLIAFFFICLSLGTSTCLCRCKKMLMLIE